MKAECDGTTECQQKCTGDKVLSVAIAGAGAIGTLFGTTLILGGNKVIFMDGWPAMLEAIEKDPKATRIESCGNEVDVPVELYAFEKAPENPVDVLWICVKSNDTRKIMTIAQSRGLIGPNTIIITLQGGFDNPDVIAEFQTDQRLVLFGKTTCSSSLTPGRFMTIQNFCIASTTVWPLGVGIHEECDPRVKQAIDVFNSAGLPMELTPNAIADRWLMLLYYPANIAYSAIVRQTFLKAWNNEASRVTLEGLAKEVALIAKLEKVDDSIFNEKVAIDGVRKLAEVECPNHSGSMLADITNKRKTENESTSGYLLKMAKHHGVHLPNSEVVYGIINCIENNYE
jgi:2-dehydropantoate 2-reductase